MGRKGEEGLLEVHSLRRGEERQGWFENYPAHTLNNPSSAHVSEHLAPGGRCCSLVSRNRIQTLILTPWSVIHSHGLTLQFPS
jgi:hypothetical protein